MLAKTTSLSDMTVELSNLTPTMDVSKMNEAIDYLGVRARTEGWSHEMFLIACLNRIASAH